MKVFVVRLWTADETSGPDPVLRGVVEPVGRARPRPFRDGDALLEVLRAELERHSASRRDIVSSAPS